jgi:CubicO group peptidase (beta-lactamase class C family)
MRQSEQPGCVVALVERGRVIFEHAFGHSNLRSGETLTPRHRFRVASHSKSFTAAGIMKLREQRKLGLDDPVGRHVSGLHRAVAEATIAQLLAHSAGIVRDGGDGGHWQNLRPFDDAAALRAALTEPPTIPVNSRFKYSNHAYGLLGLVIEAITGEKFSSWIKRMIIDRAGLTETMPDVPLAEPAPIASGHTGKLPLGRRLIIPAGTPTHALAPATGFVSTAADLSRFFAQLAPATRRSVLSVASRREMIRPQWRYPHSAIERHYGLGVASGTTAGLHWFGHSGGFQGFITRSSMFPEHRLSLSILTNAIDGLAEEWVAGAIHILAGFARNGAPAERVRDWSGRWWGLWGATDLVPMGRRVTISYPSQAEPLAGASEIVVTGNDRGRIAEAAGGGSYGETARRVRGADGAVSEIWLGGERLVPEAEIVAEMNRCYGGLTDS